MTIVDKELVGETPESSFPYVQIPTGDFFENCVKNNLARHGDRLWMVDASTGRSMKFSELLSGIRRVASALHRRGFQANDGFLIMASNHLEVPLFTFATWKAGGYVACLTLNLFAEDIRERVKENRAKFILTDEDRAPRVLEAIRQLDCVQEVFVVGRADGCTPVDVLFDDDGTSCPENANTDLNSCVWLMYSSGTTGTPKGIVHTQLSLNATLQSHTAFPISGRKFLFIHLMINGGGMAVATWSSCTHGTATTISNLSDDNLIKAIHEAKPEVVGAFPSQIAAICRHPELHKFDLSSVRAIVTGGSSISPIYERQIFDKLPNLFQLNCNYGLSETGVVVSNGVGRKLDGLTRQQAIEKHVIGSAGKILPYCRLKVIDTSTGEKLEPGQVGEICVKSPYMMKEYRNRPKETAEALREGWFHSGDKGYFDEDGNVFVIGRFKELIKYRMAHVVPSNIEKHMLTHPAIEDVGVVGLSHEVDGELPVAFVVLRPDANVTAEELIEYTNQRVVDEEKLRGGIRFINEIPRNEQKKVVRNQLTNLLLGSNLSL